MLLPWKVYPHWDADFCMEDRWRVKGGEGDRAISEKKHFEMCEKRPFMPSCVFRFSVRVYMALVDKDLSRVSVPIFWWKLSCQAPENKHQDAELLLGVSLPTCCRFRRLLRVSKKKNYLPVPWCSLIENNSSRNPLPTLGFQRFSQTYFPPVLH